MRNFTPEEKELIINTPISKDVFDMTDYMSVSIFYPPLRTPITEADKLWENLIEGLELLRLRLWSSKRESPVDGECLFTELVRLLPNSYKVVKL